MNISHFINENVIDAFFQTKKAINLTRFIEYVKLQSPLTRFSCMEPFIILLNMIERSPIYVFVAYNEMINEFISIVLLPY